MVQEAARAAGARLVLVGDTGQLGAVEAGGMFRLLAREVPCARGRYRRPDPGPAQYQDRRGRPGADQPGHAEDHRVARAPRPGTSPGARRDLDQPVSGPPRLPGRQRRAGLRGQHPCRAGPDRGHRPPAGHRHSVPPVPVRRADQGTGVQHRAHHHRDHRAARPSTLRAGVPESVVKAIPDRDDTDLPATEQIRHAQDRAGGTGHLLTLWSAAVRQSLYSQIDECIKARLSGSEAWRYDREHSGPVLQQRLRAVQLAGHDIGAVIDQITTAPFDGARSISSVLHGRLQQLHLPDLGHDLTATRHGLSAPPAGGTQPGKPAPSCSGASSPSRQQNNDSPKPKANRRPLWSGGASSKPTSPRWTGPSSASTRPRSPRASPGRPSAPRRPRPRAPRRLRSSRGCSATGTVRNRTRIRKLPPVNLRRRAQGHSRRSTGPAAGRPAWTPCRPARRRGRAPHRRRQRRAGSPRALHGPP
jgi:hypothetical protein